MSRFSSYSNFLFIRVKESQGKGLPRGEPAAGKRVSGGASRGVSAGGAKCPPRIIWGWPEGVSYTPSVLLTLPGLSSDEPFE